MKPVSKTAAFFIAFGITCIGNLAIHIPYIYITGDKMPMGTLSTINLIIFMLVFFLLPKKQPIKGETK